MTKFRKSEAAGFFYPAQPDKLKQEINLLLSVSQTEKKFNNIFGIISPHAGYIYSGRTAAYAFNAIKNKNIKNVIIISPSHREYFPGISIFNGDGYETPLGIVEVNKEIRDKLIENSKIIFKGIEGHRKEHAVEVQIPFLQMVLDDFTIIPVVMGDQGKMFIDELAEKISLAADEKTLIIASSDLSHYYSRKEADRLDSIVERRISNFQHEELQNDFDKKNCEACGAGVIVALMKAGHLKNINNTEVLHRSDSADSSGNFSEVVGYLSAVIYGN